MPESIEINNIVLKLSKEHKLINDYAGTFARNMKNPDPAFMKDLQSFLAFLENDLIKHFRLEERLFFPAAVNGAPSYETTTLVLNLQKDHGILETRLKAISRANKRLTGQNPDDPVMGTISRFLEALKTHARLEVTELFPLINANKTCLALLKEYGVRIKGNGATNGK